MADRSAKPFPHLRPTRGKRRIEEHAVGSHLSARPIGIRQDQHSSDHPWSPSESVVRKLGADQAGLFIEFPESLLGPGDV